MPRSWTSWSRRSKSENLPCTCYVWGYCRQGTHMDTTGSSAVEARVENRLVQRRPLLPACLMLLLGEADGHGYELAERLKRWGFELSGPGPVYRELRLLEEAGLVQSMWSAPQSGPVPRVYQLTAEGRAALDGVAADLADIAKLISEFQTRYAALPPPPVVPARKGRSRRR